MASNPRVSSCDVLDALLELRRLGPKRSLQRLEETDPELASYAMESLSQIHRHLLDLGGPATLTQKSFMRVQSLLLVCVFAMQRANTKSVGNDVD